MGDIETEEDALARLGRTRTGGREVRKVKNILSVRVNFLKNYIGFKSIICGHLCSHVDASTSSGRTGPTFERMSLFFASLSSDFRIRYSEFEGLLSYVQM